MKRIIIALIILQSCTSWAQTKINYIQVSQDMLQAFKDGKSADQYVEIFGNSTLQDIESQVQTNDQKLAFWVNVYNGYIQQILSKHPELYDDRRTFFSEPRVKIAGQHLSFENIEHGIIRKSQWPLGLGYIRKWFPPRYERKLRVDDRDWRIHFALNCGAKDCPPVAIYTPERVDEQFNFMTKELLNEVTEYNTDSKTAKTISLFSWFRGDFGGKCGVKNILESYGITPEQPKNIEFKSYDWTLALGNFRDIPKG